MNEYTVNLPIMPMMIGRMVTALQSLTVTTNEAVYRANKLKRAIHAVEVAERKKRKKAKK